VRLELDQPRTLGELVALTFDLFGRHLATLLTLTLIVVAPAVILVDGVWGGYLADGGNADPSAGASWTSFALGTALVPSLVTALQVVAVRALAGGEELTVGAALRLAAPRLPAAVGAVVLYSLGVALGLVALIVPGIWLGVRWYFAAQAAVVDGLGPVDALRRSAEVVDARWWRTLGVLLGFGPLIAIFGFVAGVAIEAIDNGAIYTSAQVLLRTGLLSLTAIFATLLFFDSRAALASSRAGFTTAAPADPRVVGSPGKEWL
jgi:hypothetical protein